MDGYQAGLHYTFKTTFIHQVYGKRMLDTHPSEWSRLLLILDTPLLYCLVQPSVAPRTALGGIHLGQEQGEIGVVEEGGEGEGVADLI